MTQLSHSEYQKRRDEIVNEAFSGEVSWTYDQLDGTSFIGDELASIEKRKVEAAKAIDDLVLECEKAAEERGFNKGYGECMKEWQTS